MFCAALIWGSSFVIMKNAVGVIPVNILLASRFSIACALLCLVFSRRLKEINRDDLKKTALIGLCLYLAYSFQTIGIQNTTPGKNAFLTAAYVIIVPFLYWFAGKRKPSAKNIVAALTCLAGISLISFLFPEGAPIWKGFLIGAGDAFTLLGSFFYAAHMVCLGLFSQGKDPVLLTILQFGYCAVLFSISAMFLDTMPAAVNPASLGRILYLAVFCTGLAMLFQNYGQKYTNPSAASLIMSLEAVFGVIFSILLYGEALTFRIVLGFALVFAAILISEAPPTRHKKAGAAR